MQSGRDDEPIFDDDTLWEVPTGDNAERRQAALRALDVLGEPATLRAAADGMTYDQALEDIFYWPPLRWDLEDDGDKPIHEAAWRVWPEVMHLAAMRDAESVVLTDDDRRWARELCATVRARLDEMRHTSAVATKAIHA